MLNYSYYVVPYNLMFCLFTILCWYWGMILAKGHAGGEEVLMVIVECTETHQLGSGALSNGVGEPKRFGFVTTSG